MRQFALIIFVSAQAAVPCPICGKPTRPLSEPVGPFCSKRCQLIDLGKWFGEEYRVSEPFRGAEDAEEEERTEPGSLDDAE